MDIETVLGITWYKATANDIILLAAILMIPVSIVILLRIRQKLQNLRIQEEHLFLFKLKRLGLSNFQIKIVNTIVQILKLSPPKQLLEEPELFEKAIGRFLTHTRGSGETEETQRIICKDITTIYDRLYYTTGYKRPLKSIQDVDGQQLIYFSPVPGKVFIGKIISRDNAYLFIPIFGSAGDMAAIKEGESVTFHIFRVGDAEYEFISQIHGWDRNLLKVKLPDELAMRKEARHPYIDVIIPATITREEVNQREEGPVADNNSAATDRSQEKIAEERAAMVEMKNEEMLCTIYKINDYEAVLRLTQRLDYRSRYILEFKAMDFSIKIITRLIATKTVVESDSFFYTVKYDQMSESASNVLKKFIYEHL